MILRPKNAWILSSIWSCSRSLLILFNFLHPPRHTNTITMRKQQCENANNLMIITRSDHTDLVAGRTTAVAEGQRWRRSAPFCISNRAVLVEQPRRFEDCRLGIWRRSKILRRNWRPGARRSNRGFLEKTVPSKGVVVLNQCQLRLWIFGGERFYLQEQVSSLLRSNLRGGRTCMTRFNSVNISMAI